MAEHGGLLVTAAVAEAERLVKVKVPNGAPGQGWHASLRVATCLTDLAASGQHQGLLGAACTQQDAAGLSSAREMLKAAHGSASCKKR